MSYIKRLDLQVQVIAVRRSIDGNTIYQYDKLRDRSLFMAGGGTEEKRGGVNKILSE